MTTLSPRRLMAVLVALLGFGACAALVLSRVDLDAVRAALAGARSAPLAVGAGLMLVVIGLAAAKVRAVCAAGGLEVSRGRALRAVLTAATLNPLVPGRGGELVKAWVLAPEPGRRLDAVALVVAERVLDLSVVALAAIGAGAVAGNGPAVVAGVLVLGAVAAGLGVGAMLRQSGGKLAQATEAMARMVRDPVATGRAVAWTAATWSGNLGILAATFAAAGVRAGPLEVAFAAPVSILAGMMPVTVAGLGTREAALVLLLGDRVDEASLVVGGLLYTVCTVGVAWVAGAIALAAGVVVRPPADPSPEP